MNNEDEKKKMEEGLRVDSTHQDVEKLRGPVSVIDLRPPGHLELVVVLVKLDINHSTDYTTTRPLAPGAVVLVAAAAGLG